MEDFEEYIGGFGYRLRGEHRKAQTEDFPKAPEENRRQARGAAHFLSDAPDHEEGVLLHGQYRPLCPGGAYLHPFHLAHSPLPRPRSFIDCFAKCGIQGVPSLEKQEEREKSLPAIAEHSSMTERRAEDAERELVEWKKVRFMADKLGEVFTGFVTGVTSYGFYVETRRVFRGGPGSHQLAGGRLLSLQREDGTRSRGESTGKVYRLGDRLKVRLAKVDLERRQIDFAVEELGQPRSRSSSAKPTGKREHKARKKAPRGRKKKRA